MTSNMLSLFLILVTFVCIADATNQHPTCRQIENLYQSLCTEEGAQLIGNVALQGRPGKRGAKGQKGDVGQTGPIGPVALVDYDRIDSEITNKIASEINELDTKSSALTTQIKNLEERIRILEDREGTCEIKYDGKCFWTEVRDNWFSGYAEAAAMCTKKNGKPANIYSEEHYNIIMPYLRSKILVDRVWIHLWLGMRYNARTRKLTLSDGTPAPFQQMYPGYPSSKTSDTHMTIVQRSPSTRADIGFHNMAPSARREGALCEK